MYIIISIIIMLISIMVSKGGLMIKEVNIGVRDGGGGGRELPVGQILNVSL
jgi:hypothetical protein